MSFPTLKKSIFALRLLGAATLASMIALAAFPTLKEFQVNHNPEASQAIAYRASGRFDNTLNAAFSVAYRASGRLGIEAKNALSYRGSERSFDIIDQDKSHQVEPETVAYRASGRSSRELRGALAYRASGRFSQVATSQLAYRASGRVEGNLSNAIAYRGSERGAGNEVVS